ncbi:hypothetical protein [Sorangium sp. So ce1182]|uniref:hypothetical protein n=1 Tax=Sorangium sp. So ce1182 TaxID=3133334 RepID=UPI003F5DC2AF
MDERKIQEIKAEAARQAAAGASGGMERSDDENEEPSDMPKPPVAVEARTAAQEDGERQPYANRQVSGTPAEPPPGTGAAQGEPAVKGDGSR